MSSPPTITFYLYQNPRTGNVSSPPPLSIQQLVPLVMKRSDDTVPPILPPTTQCLPVTMGENIIAKRSGLTINPDTGAPIPPLMIVKYGDTWNAVSEIPVLKEAACTEWYWTAPKAGGGAESGKGSEESSNATNGPGSCRQLWQAYEQLSEENNSTKTMVFAQGITEQWMSVKELPNLLQVFEILQNQQQQQQQQQQSLNATEGSTSSQDQQQPSEAQQQGVQDELEAFLHGVGGSGAGGKNNNIDPDPDETDAYQSDGGTNYIKDPSTGNYVHEALAPPEARERLNGKNNKHDGDSANKDSKSASSNTATNSKKKPNKSNKSIKNSFKKSNAKHWIYVSGLPTEGVTSEDVAKNFSKAGLLELDPLTLQPKVKLYRDKSTNGNKLKGDASICYANTTSVDLALQVLDESWYDETHQIKVQKATFEAKSDGENKKRPNPSQSISQAQRKVARLAVRQAQDDSHGGRLAGGRKGLRIIVVKHLLEGLLSSSDSGTKNDKDDNSLETSLDQIFAKYGEIEKMTAITETNVVIVKYVEPVAASEAVEELHGSVHPNSNDSNNNNDTPIKLEAIYWDGVTDYTTKHGDDAAYFQQRKEEEERHEEFGKWLETSQEELPPELRLQVAGEGDDD